jgi:dihydroorotase
MANTVPPIDTPERLAANLEKGSQTGIHVLQASTITKGMAGEELADLAALKEAGAACFTDDGKPLMNTELVLAAMRKAKELGMVLSFHEEDPRMITQQGINEGVAAMMLGLGSAPARSEAIMVQRDARFAQAAGARIDIQHVSSGLSVNIIRNAKAEGVDIWAEATPHHFSLTEEAVAQFGPNARMNPPLRSEIDRQAIIQGLKDGTIAMIATDHAPHTKEEKERPFQNAPSGIIGLETALALGITNLVEPEHLTMPELLAKMTCNPAACFRLDAGCEEAPEKAAGHLIEGGPADIVLFDPEEKWTVGETFVSKACNSPFVGAELTGKVKYTICSGKVVYQDA